MHNSIIRAPEGMRDRLFEECALRRERGAALSALFTRHGFREVSTPVLEHYDLFVRTGSPLPEETMVKVIDHTGRICVLRPDNTAPIARVAATRLQTEPLPLKLWHAQPVYRTGGEMLQAGAEAIGVTDDAEILRLAHEATALFFGKTPHIEVSHAAILPALCGSEEEYEAVLSLLQRKNFAELDERLAVLTRLSGGEEALDEAARLAPPVLTKPLSELRSLLQKLPALTVDLGLAPSIGYYTGIFFRGYVEGAPGAVLTGGRYDKLLGLLGRDAPAIGFAIEE